MDEIRRNWKLAELRADARSILSDAQLKIAKVFAEMAQLENAGLSKADRNTLTFIAESIFNDLNFWEVVNADRTATDYTRDQLHYCDECFELTGWEADRLNDRCEGCGHKRNTHFANFLHAEAQKQVAAEIGHVTSALAAAHKLQGGE